MDFVIINRGRTREHATVCAQSGGRWKTALATGPGGPPVSGAVSQERQMERVSVLSCVAMQSKGSARGGSRDSRQVGLGSIGQR